MGDDYRSANIVFGRLNIAPWVRSEYKHRVESFIKSGKTFLSRKFIFIIIDVKFLDGVLYGKLAKIPMEKYGIKVNQEELTSKRVPISASIAVDYSNFTINFENHVIIFESRGLLPPKQFEKAFAGIYQKNYRDLSWIKIDLISGVKEISKQLLESMRIIRAKFTITPSNPDYDEEFKPLEDLIKDTKSDKTDLDFHNKKDGLKYEKTIIEQATNLCGKGYGEYTFDVIPKGETEKITLRKKVKSVRVKFKETAENIIEEFSSQFNKYFSDFIKKTK